jgi:hypothetical protein
LEQLGKDWRLFVVGENNTADRSNLRYRVPISTPLPSGHVWNAEKGAFVMPWVPKFKMGDIVRKKGGNPEWGAFAITGVDLNTQLYCDNMPSASCGLPCWREDEIELAPDPYAELKAAHAAGKVIQHYATNCVWVDSDRESQTVEFTFHNTSAWSGSFRGICSKLVISSTDPSPLANGTRTHGRSVRNLTPPRP